MSSDRLAQHNSNQRSEQGRWRQQEIEEDYDEYTEAAAGVAGETYLQDTKTYPTSAIGRRPSRSTSAPTGTPAAAFATPIISVPRLAAISTLPADWIDWVE